MKLNVTVKPELPSPDGKAKVEDSLSLGMPDFIETVKLCGGPMQYIVSNIEKTGEAEFAKQLAAFIEPLPEVAYNTGASRAIGRNLGRAAQLMHSPG